MNRSKNVLIIIIIAGMSVGLFVALNQAWDIIGIDWKETFYPAARALLEGKTPYTVPTFRNVPWTALLLLPFAVFSERVGGILFFIASAGIYAWTAYRLQASRIALIAFLLSPPVVYGLRMLNVDIFILLGFTLPASVGLFFVLIKPQMGAVMAVFWLFRAWRQGGIKQTLQTFAPVTLTLLLSFAAFGNWLQGRQADLLDSFWNASLWPWAIPIGVVLTALSLRDLREDLAIAASPFLSPYLAYHSWAAALTGLMRRDFELIVAVAAMWFVALIRALGLG
jgi:hypothetical protein